MRLNKNFSWVLSLLAVSQVVAQVSFAETALPPKCMDGSNQLGIINEKVVDWKTTTRNQFHARALIEGKFVRMTENRNSHYHFIIQLEDSADSQIEVVYNKSFGEMPELKVGDMVLACGDYITSNAPAGYYKPSPAGAIIHWVHYNPGDRNKTHEHGFIYVSSGDKKYLVGYQDNK